MKRKNENSDNIVGNRYYISIDCYSSKRALGLASDRLPSSFLTDAHMLDTSIQKSLQSVVDGSAVDSSKMETDDLNHLKFLVFLGAQGKEYIDEIHHMFPPHFDSLVFVSLNIDAKFALDPSIHCSDSQMCKELASHFNILDPLGGGTYPLNYLIVTDSDLLVRCKLPIRIGTYYRGHQRFGVNLSQLQGLIDEYLQFFMHNHLTLPLIS